MAGRGIGNLKPLEVRLRRVREAYGENPAINSPFRDPRRHFRFSDEEISGWDKQLPDGSTISTARDLWVPAVNNHGGFGRWAFIEIADPWDAKNLIQGSVGSRSPR